MFGLLGDVPNSIVVPSDKPAGGSGNQRLGMKGKKDKKDAAAGEAPEKIRQAVMLARLHAFGVVSVPVDELSHPDPDIAVRPVSEQHVGALMKSFSYHQSVPDLIHVVIRDDALVRRKADKGLDLSDLKSSKFEVFSGAHTVAAMKRLHAQQPNNALFATIKCSILVCPRSFEVTSAISTLGLSDNAAKVVIRAMTYSDILTGMHEQLVAARLAGETVKMKDFNAQWAAASGKALSNMSNISWYAQRTGALWDCLSDLLNTQKYDGRNGRVRAIGSQNVLLPLRGLSDEQQTHILKKVQQGMSWKQAGALAVRVKCMACCKIRVMSEIKARHPDLPHVALDNWSVYSSKFPQSTDPKWLAKWIEGLSKQGWDESQPFPHPVSKHFMERYLNDKRGVMEMKLQQVFSHFLFIFTLFVLVPS